MARPLRVEIEDGLYHVTNRGNARQAIFHDSVDFQSRMDWVRRTIETYSWHLHAFVLMNNHDHLFVETPRANLAAGMQYVNGGYTIGYNRRHGRVGHLFQGRYKAVLIESEGHYWELSRYIHLNPVRARLVQRPEQWAWSSYSGYHAPRRQLPWVTYERVLGEFGDDATSARAAYRRFVAEGLDRPPPSPLGAAVQGLVLGSDGFVQRIRGLLADRPDDPELPVLRQLRDVPPLERIIARAAEAFGEDAAGWTGGRRDDSIGRAVAAWLARRRFGYPAGQTARALGYAGASSVAQAIRRVTNEHERLVRRLRQLERDLAND
jgi:putative transposase